MKFKKKHIPYRVREKYDATSNYSLENNCNNFTEFFREIKKKHMPYRLEKNMNILINTQKAHTLKDQLNEHF